MIITSPEAERGFELDVLHCTALYCAESLLSYVSNSCLLVGEMCLYTTHSVRANVSSNSDLSQC